MGKIIYLCHNCGTLLKVCSWQNDGETCYNGIIVPAKLYTNYVICPVCGSKLNPNIGGLVIIPRGRKNGTRKMVEWRIPEATTEKTEENHYKRHVIGRTDGDKKQRRPKKDRKDGARTQTIPQIAKIGDYYKFRDNIKVYPIVQNRKLLKNDESREEEVLHYKYTGDKKLSLPENSQGDEEDMRVVSFKLDEETIELLETLAEKRGVTKSEIIRRAIREYLKVHDNKPVVTKRITIY